MFIIEVWKNVVLKADELYPSASELLIAARSTKSAGSARMIANSYKGRGHWVNLVHPDGTCEFVN